MMTARRDIDGGQAVGARNGSEVRHAVRCVDRGEEMISGLWLAVNRRATWDRARESAHTRLVLFATESCENRDPPRKKCAQGR